MDKDELEDFRRFLGPDADESLTNRVYFEYFEKFKDSIQSKSQNFRGTITQDEMDSDAIMAIHEMVKESVEVVERFIKLVNPKSIFNKHLMKIARQNKKENQPLTKSIKENFKATTRNPVYQGYDNFNATVPDTFLVSVAYIDEEKEVQDEIKELFEMIAPQANSPVYLDLVDYYFNGKSFQQIASLKRNGGKTKQAIFKRLKNYMGKIGKKLRG